VAGKWNDPEAARAATIVANVSQLKQGRTSGPWAGLPRRCTARARIATSRRHAFAEPLTIAAPLHAAVYIRVHRPRRLRDRVALPRDELATARCAAAISMRRVHAAQRRFESTATSRRLYADRRIEHASEPARCRATEAESHRVRPHRTARHDDANSVAPRSRAARSSRHQDLK
jgi:hypothetical protein